MPNIKMLYLIEDLFHKILYPLFVYWLGRPGCEGVTGGSWGRAPPVRLPVVTACAPGAERLRPGLLREDAVRPALGAPGLPARFPVAGEPSD